MTYFPFLYLFLQPENNKNEDYFAFCREDRFRKLE